MSLFHHMRKISQELHRDLGNDVDVISTLLSFYYIGLFKFKHTTASTNLIPPYTHQLILDEL